MWLVPWAGRKDKPFGFRWPEVSVCALGIHFTNDSTTSDKLNFEKKLEDLQRIHNSWKRRKLTLLGKINIVKVTVDLRGVFRRIIRMRVACALTTEKYISS